MHHITTLSGGNHLSLAGHHLYPYHMHLFAHKSRQKIYSESIGNTSSIKDEGG